MVELTIDRLILVLTFQTYPLSTWCCVKKAGITIKFSGLTTMKSCIILRLKAFVNKDFPANYRLNINEYRVTG